MLFPRFSIFFLALLSCTPVIIAQTGVQTNTTAQPPESVYVILQLQPLDATLDSAARKQTIKSWVDIVKQANTQLGYKEMEKKIASFNLEETDGTIPYLSIRSFMDMTAASDYAEGLKSILPGEIYGAIERPFPVTLSVYRICLEQKDFMTYYRSIQLSKD